MPEFGLNSQLSGFLPPIPDPVPGPSEEHTPPAAKALWCNHTTPFQTDRYTFEPPLSHFEIAVILNPAGCLILHYYPKSH